MFSQFTMMLDILEDLMEYKEWVYQRLDGQTSIIERQNIIDDFNDPKSECSIFLLSTRAGGYVILYIILYIILYTYI